MLNNTWNYDVTCFSNSNYLCPSPNFAKRPLVTIEAMVALKAGLDLSNAFDAAVWAVVCIAFWSYCRLGELLIPSLNLFDNAKHVSCASIPTSDHTLPNGTAYTTFHIPWTKTTAREGADISITSRQHVCCPLAALRHHTSANILIPDTAPMFSFETADGAWAPMTKPWFMSWCNDVWVAAGFPDMPGHAFRIGGATELLLQGINPNIVATQGCWKSRAFLEYWWRIEVILPLFISNSSNSSRTLNLDASMSSFAQQHNLTLPSSA
ncbi:hypothetical protein BDZ94DRAFT_1316512 [Collybia nuda]|uniref:Tyr recombinase domain-containing protein n=1 Tax=Collybia nuda TaxID=64659 RepID=A0A9P5XPI2_9AGAR|nr:hypothetical protein BDZ94DRAFT_1316512 [Collybia nuda]